MFLRTTTSALAIAMLTTPALADVTPAEVWQNWVEYYKANGYSVTEGSREEAGQTLTLRDVVVGYAVPEEDVTVEFRTPQIALTATGDGRVRTTLAETSPVTATFPDDDEGAVTLNGRVVVRDTEVVSSGTPADMTHETRSGEVVMALDSVTTSEGTREAPVTVRLVNLTSRQQMTDNEAVGFDVGFAAERVELSAEFDDIEDADTPPARMMLTGSLQGLQGTSRGTMPKGVDMATDLNAALKAGMDVSAAISAGQGSFDFEFAGKDDDGEDETAKGNSAIEGFEIAIGFGQGGLKYQGAVDSISTEITASGMPMPVSYRMQETTFDMQMPVMKSDEPAPFKFAYSIGGLTMGDGIWDLFDAARVLPRDPANMDIDITGMVRVAMDLFDPAMMAAAADMDRMDDDADHEADDDMPDPFEPVEVTINKLSLQAVGASLDASGELRVPEGGSVEQPVGALSARLEGVNGLIDRLVQMGVISSDEVAGYRMMLAMFARPAPEGGDVLVSEFEFREDGQIFANDQQVK